MDRIDLQPSRNRKKPSTPLFARAESTTRSSDLCWTRSPFILHRNRDRFKAKKKPDLKVELTISISSLPIPLPDLQKLESHLHRSFLNAVKILPDPGWTTGNSSITSLSSFSNLPGKGPQTSQSNVKGKMLKWYLGSNREEQGCAVTRKGTR